jgi:hypothetical protein
MDLALDVVLVIELCTGATEAQYLAGGSYAAYRTADRCASAHRG